MALPDSSPKQESQQGQSSKAAGDQDDKDFDPAAEALVEEVDDERTLEEEEALGGANGTAVQEEIDELKRESEMPLEDLLSHYERMRQENPEIEGELGGEDAEDEEDGDDFSASDSDTTGGEEMDSEESEMESEEDEGDD